MKNNKPDFLIVGAAKSGTTSIFHYLNNHPNVFVPSIKECRFFSQLQHNYIGLGAEFFPNSGITNKNEYFDLYKGKENKVCGDISNDYLYYYEKSIKNIKKYLTKDIKIIIILRNPVTRAYSNYKHAVSRGWENSTFKEAIIKEKLRIKNNWAWPYHYTEVGKYYDQLKAYLDNFKNVKILLFEDMIRNTNSFMSDIYSFLGVKNIVKNNYIKHHVSQYIGFNKILFYVQKNKLYKKFINVVPKEIKFYIINKYCNLKPYKISMKKETKVYLSTIYKKDVQRTENLLNRNLSNWIQDAL